METRPIFFQISTGFSGPFAAGPPPQPPALDGEVEAEAESEEEAEAKEDDAAEGHSQRNTEFAPNQRGDGTINPPFP